MRRWLAAAALALAVVVPAHAAIFRWTNDYDVRSLDPYSGRETFLRGFVGNIYEPLVRRGRDLALEPALATRWQEIAPGDWRFALRRGVVFQDGTPFSADDVVFSFARARAAGSRVASLLASVKDVRKLDDATVEITTDGPNPLLLDALSQWFIMSRQWCEAHEAETPGDPAHSDDSFAADHANGTGPFAVTERIPGERTVLVPNLHWWDKREHNLDSVVFTPIADAAARVAALESGATDMIYDVPPASIDSIAQRPGLRIVEGPGLTTIFLGFDLWRDQLVESNLKNRNPWKDRRVRRAVELAIDERVIIDKVMRGHATAAGLLIAPGVAGYDKAGDVRPPYDPAEAKRLLATAGYAGGFETGMDCTNDRYVNDQAVCEEVVAMLAKVGIRVQLLAQNRARFFAKIMPPPQSGMKTSFFLMGWTPASYDGQGALVNLLATRDPAQGLGAYNVAGYSNPALDALIARIRVESDEMVRLGLLRKALLIVKNDTVYIPLHRQDVVWAARQGIDLVQRADDIFNLRYVRVK